MQVPYAGRYSACMELLERESQLGELLRLQAEAAAGTGKLVFLGGEAGAGKSALAEEFSTHLRGATTLWGHADALETSRVLGPVAELAASLQIPTPRTQQAALAREELFAAIVAQLVSGSIARVIVLEDMHWADEATLDFVRFLGRRIQRTRCLLIATHRDDELTPTHLLRSVLGELTGQHTARIPMAALSLAAVERLAEGTPRNASQVHQVTGGNPIFVRELLSAPVDAVPGAHILQMDFTDPACGPKLLDLLGDAPDLILSDMAPNTVGHRITDHLRIAGLIEAAIDFTLTSLKPGGAFVAKAFQGGETDEIIGRLRRHFAQVRYVKPKASRQDSSELFLVATGFKGIRP